MYAGNKPLFTVGKLTVRSFCEADVDSILQVYRESEDFISLGPVSQASLKMVRDDIDHAIKEHGVFCVISHEQSGIIGVMDFAPLRGDSNTSILALLMIATPQRRMGYGKSIMAAFEKYLVKTYKTKVIKAGVMVNNPLAIKFWEKTGFSINPTPEPMPDKTTVYRMTKKIG
jgi:ribosomal protein S18 acetylase RimI-like enzyme